MFFAWQLKMKKGWHAAVDGWPWHLGVAYSMAGRYLITHGLRSIPSLHTTWYTQVWTILLLSESSPFTLHKLSYINLAW